RTPGMLPVIPLDTLLLSTKLGRLSPNAWSGYQHPKNSSSPSHGQYFPKQST
ncbi:16148_t:CDS:2, partial [Dentiscutata heterogama]